MNRSFGNALILVVVSEIVLSVLLLAFADPVLKIFGVTETAYPYALAYYKIVALASAASRKKKRGVLPRF